MFAATRVASVLIGCPLAFGFTAARDGGLMFLQTSAASASSFGVVTQAAHQVGVNASAPIGAEYVCGGVPGDGCPDCPANPVCTCNGLVRFGNGDQWSDYVESNGAVECSSATFGFEPDPTMGKKCMCKPTFYQCASEYLIPTASCATCNMPSPCTCIGEVRFGYGNKWTPWIPVHGTVECQTSVFGDPFVGQGKVCQCKPEIATAPEATVTKSLLGGFRSADRTTWAMIVIIVTYFSVLVPLNYVRILNKLIGSFPGPLETSLNSTANVCLYFAPMMCACNFAVTQRAESVTAFQAAKHGLPQPWLSGAVFVAAVAFFFHTFFFIMRDATISWGTGQNAERMHVLQGMHRLAKVWTALSSCALLLMFASLLVMLTGTLMMSEPADVVARVGKTPMSVPTQVTIFLSILYFGVNLPLAACELFGYVNNQSAETLHLCAMSVSFAPTTCISFIGAEVAATWNGVVIPNYVEVSMYIVAANVLLLVLIELARPALASIEIFVKVVHWVVLTVMYTSAATVCISAWSYEISSDMTRMVFRVGITFFCAHLFLWIQVTFKNIFSADVFQGSRLLNEDRGVVCSMLAVLIIAAWVRARSIKVPDGQVGEPQHYIQDQTFIAALALVVQWVFDQSASLVTQAKAAQLHDHACERLGSAHLKDMDNNMKEENLGILNFIWFWYYVAVIVLYTSIVIIIYGLFTLGPETVTDAGSWKV